MLTICLVKLISVLLNYIDVRGKATNKLYFFKQQAKKKKKNPADIMLNKWNRAAAKTFWLGLQFLLSQTFSCNTRDITGHLQVRWLTVEILWTIISPCSLGERFP